MTGRVPYPAFMRKKLFIAAVLIAFALSLPAVTEYDIGGGQKVLLYEDGTYDVVAPRMDTSKLAGSQYSLDWDALLSFFADLMIVEDPDMAILDKGFVTGMLRAMIGEFEIHFVFLSSDEVLVSMTGEIPDTFSYRLDSNRNLYVEDERIGGFSEDYSRLNFVIEGIPLTLVKIK